MLSPLIAILEFHSDQNPQGRSRVYEKCFPEPNTPHYFCVLGRVFSLSFSHRRDVVRIRLVDICEALPCLVHNKHSINITSYCQNISDINIRHVFLKYNLNMSQRIFFMGSLCTGIIFSFSPSRQEISIMDFHAELINRSFFFQLERNKWWDDTSIV